MRTVTRIAAVALSAGFLATPALAQDATNDRAPQRDRARQGQGNNARTDRAPMSPERMQAAWTWQARTVGAALKADAATTKQIAAAWMTVRTEMATQQREMAEARRAEREARGGAGDAGDAAQGRRGRRGGAGAGPGQGQGQGRGAGAGDAGQRGQGRGEARGANNPAAEMREKAMASLKGKLSATLSGAQLEAAMKAFSVNTGQWDRSTDAIAQLKLEEANAINALLAMHTYLAETGRIMQAARDGGDREGMREAMGSARATLELGLTEALSDEQMQTVMQSMRAARGNARGGRGGAAGEGRGGRGGRGGPDNV